jgi:hypothetical protein
LNCHSAHDSHYVVGQFGWVSVFRKIAFALCALKAATQCAFRCPSPRRHLLPGGRVSARQRALNQEASWRSCLRNLWPRKRTWRDPRPHPDQRRAAVQVQQQLLLPYQSVNKSFDSCLSKSWDTSQTRFMFPLACSSGGHIQIPRALGGSRG